MAPHSGLARFARRYSTSPTNELGGQEPLISNDRGPCVGARSKAFRRRPQLGVTGSSSGSSSSIDFGVSAEARKHRSAHFFGDFCFAPKPNSAP